MRDEKEERSKQGQTNNKAKQHSTPNVHHDVACTYMYMLMRDEGRKKEVSTCRCNKESCNNKPMYGYMLPNLSPSPNLYKVQSVYNNNVAS